MAEPIHDTSHVAEGLARLIGNYQDPAKPNVRALVAVLMRRVQELEDVLWSIFASQMLATPPTGNALDQLGDLVREPRGTFTDAEYLEPKYLQPLIDVCAKYGLIDKTFPAQEVISSVAVKPPR